MKRIYLIVAMFAILGTAFAQSPRKQANGKIDGVAVDVDYGSPSVKGRKIWGGLEPYDKVWRAGANEATTVTFSKAVKINGKDLAAGQYAFFIIPRESGKWTVIFNTEAKQWGAFKHDKSKDALRVDVEPEWSDDVQESLMYSVDGTLNFAWEKARLGLKVKGA